MRLVAVFAFLSAWVWGQEDAPTPGVIGVVFAQRGEQTIVARVLENGPAAKAGLKAGDVVLQVGGENVTQPMQARNFVYHTPPKSKLSFQLLRVNEIREVEVVAGTYDALKSEYAPKKPETGSSAPEWFAESWNLPEGQKEAPTPASTKGKVVILLAYQAFCPACTKLGMPNHAKLETEYAANKDVVFLYAHTVFEGFEHNTPEAGVKLARELGIKGAVFEDARLDANIASETVRLLGVAGTPWSMVINKQGKLTFSQQTGDGKSLGEAVKAAVEAK